MAEKITDLGAMVAAIVGADLIEGVDKSDTSQDPAGSSFNFSFTQVATFTNANLDGASVKAAYEGEADTNVFDDAAVSKLSGIEASATADQTGAEIKVAYEGESDTNAFTDTEQSKLSGIESGATGDQTGAEIKIAYEAESDTNAYTDTEKSKLGGIESLATADQTGAEIKVSYEAEADTNAFADADVTKLGGIEALADVTDSTNVAASLTNGVAGLTAGEVTQLAKINTKVISETNWTAVTNLTGTNSGDQTITLTGNVTGSGTGSFAATISNDAVTYAKMQNVSGSDKVLGRISGSGDVEEITMTGAGRDLMDDATAAAQATTLGLGTLDSPTFAGATLSNAPTASTDAANKAYVDGIAAGFDPKESCRLATTGTLTATAGNGTYVAAGGPGAGKTLTAGTTGTTDLDGTTVADGDRILIKDEADVTDNGIHVVSDAAGGSKTVFTRSTDFDGDPGNEVSGGAFTLVEIGTANSNTQWAVSNDGDIVVDTDNIVFVKISDITQTITLTGDITGSGTGSFGTTISADSVTYDKMQDTTVSQILLGRNTASGGTVEEVTTSQIRTMINVENGSTADQTGAEIKSAYEGEADTNAFDDAAVTKLGGIEALADVTDAANVAAALGNGVEALTTAEVDQLENIGTTALSAADWVALSNLSGINSGDQTITLTGDVTGSGTGSFAATIGNNKVTLAKMAQMATASFLGRTTASTGDVEVLSAGAARTVLNVENGSTADQTGGEIKTAYEGESDTNAFTDSDVTNLGNQSGTNTGDEVAASDTIAGVIEVATIAETNTGTATDRAVTPDGLAGSTFGSEFMTFPAAKDFTFIVEDGAGFITVPLELNGYVIVKAEGDVITAGVTGTMTWDLFNVTSGQDVFSTAMSFATTALVDDGSTVVIDTVQDDLTTGDILRWDIVTLHSGTVAIGGSLKLTLRKP